MLKTVGERSYWVEDKGLGKPLVMLHGFTGSTRTFDEAIEYLGHPFRIIQIDLPGHGQTGDQGCITMEEFCEDVRSLLQQLGVSSTALLGYSLGGRAALTFAVLYPEMVSRLFLESSSPGLASSEDQLLRQAKDRAIVQMIEEEGLEAFVDYWESLPLFQSQDQLPAQTKKKIRQERLNQDPNGLQQSLIGMGTGSQPSWWGQLAKIDMEIVLITGDKDHKFRNINKKMNGRMTNVTWIEVAETGHAVHIEKPSDFAKIVGKFMVQ